MSPLLKLKSEIELDYKSEGNPNGIPLIFVHGWISDRTVFDLMIANLPEMVKQKYWIITYSQYGYGESSKPEATIPFKELIASHTMESHARNLDFLLDALKITTPIILIGHSMGGFVSLSFAALFPKKVKVIIPISTGPK